MAPEASLMCANCGHDRSFHPGNESCNYRIRISGGSVGCACVRFHFDPNVSPNVEAEPEQEWSNPVTLTALAAVSHLDRGDFDPYIELILAAAHQRKLALRGVRGFPRLDQRGRTRRDESA